MRRSDDVNTLDFEDVSDDSYWLPSGRGREPGTPSSQFRLTAALFSFIS